MIAVAMILGLLATPAPGAAPAKNGGKGDSTLNRSADQVGAEVDRSLEWLQRRRTFTMNGVPYGLTGLPILFYTPSSGLRYGAWVQITDYRMRPYLYRVKVQWLLTTNGKRNHYVSVDLLPVPTEVRFITQDLDDIDAHFFGIGNNTKVNKDSVAAEPDYYRYVLEQQKTAFDLEQSLAGPLAAFVGVRFARTKPSRVNPTKDTYFVFRQPDLPGVTTGWTNTVALGIILDTRDDRDVPTRGALSDFSVRKAFRWLGSNNQELRLTLIHTRYIPLRRRYTIVARAIIESMTGNTPFYEMSEIGGSLRTFDVMGAANLRGYVSRRFAAQDKLLLTAEVRRSFAVRRWHRQYIMPQAIAFADLGRFASSFAQMGIDQIHSSAGLGLRFTWNEQLSLRSDIAVSPEGHRFLFRVGSQF